uniref:Uncharacterized protein n=1 Tax=Salvator merianae TaxID=96440 RepID=A0A8D0C613_SALMN
QTLQAMKSVHYLGSSPGFPFPFGSTSICSREQSFSMSRNFLSLSRELIPSNQGRISRA